MKKAIASEEQNFAKAISRLVVCNHFLPERIQLEREALGNAFVDDGRAPWNLDYLSSAENQNIRRLTERCEEIISRVSVRLHDGGVLSGKTLSDYENVVGYALYQRYRKDFQELAQASDSFTKPVRCFTSFNRDVQQYVTPARGTPVDMREVGHYFAILSQLERAFILIFANIVGASPSIARLRAMVWESIFTCDFQRYTEILHNRMSELTTLITGPSGTGKELVARAIARSAFIPFDPQTRRFAHGFDELFMAVNLSALSSNLVEAELFGHKRGAFTGALFDRVGWLESCSTGGSVFLDEIGEIETTMQVKLLRVLQSRTFQRLGETLTRTFRGKIIAATNRDLVHEIQRGRFREDFYYRLCSDVVTTPSLQQQLAESPEDLPRLVGFIARGLVGENHAEALVAEVTTVIEKRLGPDYAWPGNFRELEQCVRNVLVRGDYRPVAVQTRSSQRSISAELDAGQLTAEQLLERYCFLIYSRTGNVEEVARRLDLDRRTVRARLRNCSVDQHNSRA